MNAAVVAFGALALVLVGPVRAGLTRLHAVARAPRAGIVVWQALALSSLLAIFGALASALLAPFGSSPVAIMRLSALLLARPSAALTPNELFALTAGLIVSTLAGTAVLARTAGMLRARAHHRLLVDLIGDPDVAAPGALVVPNAHALAYCVPGRRARIVVSSAALGLLDHDELDAVLAHERAHVRARHHLVLLPYLVAASLLGPSRAARSARDAVRGLVEMAADDRALRDVAGASLARAICRLGTEALPALAFGATGSLTLDRVERALAARRTSRPVALGCAVAAAGITASPFLVALTWR